MVELPIVMYLPEDYEFVRSAASCFALAPVLMGPIVIHLKQRLEVPTCGVREIIA